MCETKWEEFWMDRNGKRGRSSTTNFSEWMITFASTNDTSDITCSKKFSYGELVLATANFSYEKKLGEGSFGNVYKGYLSDSNLSVAVKKISMGSKQGKREFLTAVKIIRKLLHRNLVQLIGWCHDQGEFFLVYEFVPNGSLDMHLFGKKITLSWTIRYKIAIGLASALFYLHEDSEQSVVHGNIKSSNVMFDTDFNAKLGHFRLAQLMDQELGLHTAMPAETMGYFAPEYISSGRISKESDVYSFGVVALEIACGRRAVKRNEEESRIELVEWVWDLYGNGRLIDAADERLHKDFDVTQMECLIIVGLWCAHPDHNLRPSIRQVIGVLHFEASMPNLPSKMPAAIHLRSSSSANSSHSSIASSSTMNGYI
ncbi:Serine/threonine protein kinase [Cinnamomum micranthum f. kanehirae]|uniref:Serine/threonine protein kinase n=1 Tax=Cinnamomum micranthum f. kanehirae TaxID=337451 RepID=A0A3S3PWC0_9MAGN|nr:Serine/threonine protein kinase [Cinnamomum micranthum f. kanehirae]